MCVLAYKYLKILEMLLKLMGLLLLLLFLLCELMWAGRLITHRTEVTRVWFDQGKDQFGVKKAVANADGTLGSAVFLLCCDWCDAARCQEHPMPVSKG